MVGIISNFYMHGGSMVMKLFFWLVSILAFVGFIYSVWSLYRELRQRNDELVKKVLRDSAAFSFIVIILLHFAQMLIRGIYFSKTGQDINLVVTPGLYIDSLGDKGNLHLESFDFDFVIFSLSLFFNKLRFRF